MDVISHEQGAEAGIEAAAKSGNSLKAQKASDVVRRSKSMTSLERLQIYHTSYYMRLVDILSSDFNAIKYAVGDDVFAELARDFISKHPSERYSLNFFGGKFSAFLRGVKKLKHRAFLSDVAKLQWANEEVFDAPQAPTLSVDELLSVPQAKWPEAKLRTIPAIRLISSRYPISAYFTAYRKEQTPTIPHASPTWLCVYRKEYDIWRMDLTRPEYTVLTALSRGKTVGAALESALELPEMKDLDLGATVTEWFRIWTRSGFFSKVELS